MSEEEMELEEARLLSAEIGLSVPNQEVVAPDSERTLATVEMEIRVIQHNTAQAMLSGAIETGRRLVEAKAMLPHGEWGVWLRKMDLSPSTAQNFMKIFREYGDDQQSLFGGVAKSQAFGKLTYTKALQLLALPSNEERERFLTEHDVESMSTRELAEAIKARDEAEEAVAAAQDEIRKIQQRADLLQEQLAGQDQVYQAKLTSAGIEADQAKAAAKAAQDALDKQKDKSQRLQDALSEANASVQAAEEEHTLLVQELEELRNRPTEADTEAVEAARQAALDEMTEKVDKAKEAKKKAEEKRKEAEASLAAAQKELAELKAKEPEVRELTQAEKDALIAAAVEQARAGDAEQIRSLEKKLTQADPNVAEFKVLFDSWQEDYQKLMSALGRITDPEKAAKLRRAVQGAVEKMAG